MQVVGYEPRADGPAAILIAEAGSLRRESLEPGTELAYGLGDRRCAGTIEQVNGERVTGEKATGRDADGEREHVPCEASDAPYCALHTDRWPCARCTGDCSLPIDNCREEHAVYLAAFAPDTFKVGVTKSWRLERRLREQGADRGAHLRTVKDGRIARQIEAELANAIGDRVGVPAKIRGLHRPVDEDAWADLLAEHAHEETLAFEYDLDLDERPQQETVLAGTVRGAKGRVLVLDNAGSTYAVDLRDLVGHELAKGGTDRDLQSSLGAFE